MLSPPAGACDLPHGVQHRSRKSLLFAAMTVAAIVPAWTQQRPAIAVPGSATPTVTHPTTAAQPVLAITVVDENGIAIPGAQIVIRTAASPSSEQARCSTDYAGRCRVLGLAPGRYVVHIDKPGFYRLHLAPIQFPVTTVTEAVLTHEQVVRQTVNVVGSPPVIDPEKVADTRTLTTSEILNVPYPTSRDVRNLLPMLPNVVREASGQIHVAGTAAPQTLTLLDGFDISAPAPGFIDMRVNADSVRTIDAQSSRYSTQYGKGSSILGMDTGMGDDQFRFSATNFFPSFQLKKGLNINTFVPRATFSGPLRKGKVWFFEAPELEYVQTIVPQLPSGADRSTQWRTGNLTKLQFNLAPGNILQTEFVANNFHQNHFGLSLTNPAPTTTDRTGAAYMGALKDLHYFHSGALLETGLAIVDYSAADTPLGDVPFQIRPELQLGSFYLTSRANARRLQGITNFYLPPWSWHGRHELKIGMDSDSVSYRTNVERRPVSILREDLTLARRIVYTGPAHAETSNFQSAFYVQDRWTPSHRLLLEPGLRGSWDQIIRQPFLSPRIASTYMLARGTKLSAGVGLYDEATNLEMISRPTLGQRLDYFYAPDGTTLAALPVQTQFFVNRRLLTVPSSLNWSLTVEHKLPKVIYVSVEYLQRRGRNGFSFLNAAGPNTVLGNYVLSNTRQDRYDSLTITARHTFKGLYPILVSYTHSSAHTNQAVDFSVDNAVLSPQQPGPLPWDAPNRIIAWGWFPFIKHFDVGYSMDWRTGFPFNAVNQDQAQIGRANSFRLPHYFALNLSLERRFHILGRYIALRGTLENATGETNPTSVINNIDSPRFLAFSGTGHRTLTARIRFLGRSAGATSKATASSHQPQEKPKDKP
ncbi:MAG: carboxypeptidase regulatory-like domain-containing protein [Terriglobales bacterium]